MSRNIFNAIKSVKIKKTNFDLSHSEKLSCNMGYLYPLNVLPVVPGDKFSMSVNCLTRFMPMLAPVIHKVKISFHQFYVPNRLLMELWNDYITGKDDTIEAPYITLTKDNCGKGSLLEFIYGVTIPSTSNNTIKVDAMPLRAYNLIWNYFYRDQDLQEEVTVSLEDGEDTTTNQELLKRCWMKDYFTSARTSPQSGGNVTFPIGDKAPVIGNGTTIGFTDGTENYGLNAGRGDGIAQVGYNTTGYKKPVGTADSAGGMLPNKTFGLVEDAEGSGMVADLSSAQSGTIQQLRTAFAMQKFLELTIRAGNRIKEYLASHFGVISSDARLDMPEFLGGSVSDLIISEVLQQSAGTETSPQGNMSGHGFGYSQNMLCRKKFFEEHGYLITMMSIVPKTGYSQGISRLFTKLESRFDYPLPVFQHIGEQEIKNKEIYADQTEENQEKVFGYAPRYCEYKYIPDKSYGELNDTLDYWHLNRKFDAAPALNEDFVECSPSKRIFAVTDEDEDSIIVSADFSIRAKRPFTYFSNPKMVG